MLLVVAAGLWVAGRPETRAVGPLGAVVFVCGLLPLTERLYEWAWGKLFGKIMIAGLIALATNYAYGYGRQMVAGLIGACPESLTASVSLATILLSPLLFMIILATGGLVILVMAAYVGTLALTAYVPPLAPGKGRRVCLWACRIVALGIAVVGSWALIGHSDGYGGWVSQRTAKYLYTFEMYRDPYYAPGNEEKVAFLPDGRLLVASPRKGGYAFDIRKPNEADRGAAR